MIRTTRNESGPAQRHTPEVVPTPAEHCQQIPSDQRSGGCQRPWRGTRRLLLHSTFITLVGFNLLALPYNRAEARYASIVTDAQSGAVLHQINADTRNYPASLVKMMTLYLTFEALNDNRIQPEQRLAVSHRAANMPPSRLGLRVGQTIRVKDAILALVTKSANDVAVVLAEALGENESKFAQIMTQKAHALGMNQTTFRNATGLPDRRQLSTARDMATLAQALLRDFPEYYHLFSVTEFRYNNHIYGNHNRLLDTYSGADGIKTGYTRASGFNLATSVKRGRHRVIAVVFGGDTAQARDRHMVKLLDQAFARIGGVEDLASLSPTQRAPVVDERRQRSLAQGDRDARTTDGITGRYGAQVGAYYRYNMAERAAVEAARLLPETIDQPLVWVPKVKGRNGSLFLARLVGLTENDAKQACQHLKAAAIDCLTIKARPPTRVASN